MEKFKIFTLPNQFPYHFLKRKKFKIGFDPKIHTKQNLERIFKKTSCELVPSKQNLIDKIWNRKTNQKEKKFYILPEYAVGQNYKYKKN